MLHHHIGATTLFSHDEEWYLPIDRRHCAALFAPANATPDSGSPDDTSRVTQSPYPLKSTSSKCDGYAIFANKTQAMGLPAFTVRTNARS